MEHGRIYSFPTACLDYFGKLPNQTTAEFAQELKALTDADRAEFKEALTERGYKFAAA